MTRLHIPQTWREAARAILEDRLQTILILGAADRGKSTFCGYLARELVGAGHRVALVDADIGQKDIGPPAAITMGYTDGDAALRAITPAAYYFVGSTSPVGRMLPLVVGTAHLARAADAPFVIVDTTGYIDGGGRILKGYKIEAVQPNLIVGIARKRELEPVLKPYSAFRTARIKPSRKAHPKDSWDRYLVRKRAFARYFANAGRLEVDLDSLAFQRSLLFTGEPVAIEGALYAERMADGIVAVAESAPAETETVKTLRPDFARNLLCGLADEHNECLGLAVLEDFDFERRTVALHSPVPAGKIRILQFGDLYIDLEGRELGRVGREGI
jgi:polynucleotide 5'-hydroxyl-kinase GRC3/NOL9